MSLKLCLPVILFAASAAAATDRIPQAGGYGFNWLDAESQCKKLTDKDLASVTKCEVSTNAFGLELSSHVCKVNSHIEFVVYKTAAECKEALETMQSNGP